MKEASLWEPLIIKCPDVKFSTLYYLPVSAFISLAYKTDYKKAILHGGHKVVVLYMHTNCILSRATWRPGFVHLGKIHTTNHPTLNTRFTSRLRIFYA